METALLSIFWWARGGKRRTERKEREMKSV
jgi:hypothetical protein